MKSDPDINLGDFLIAPHVLLRGCGTDGPLKSSPDPTLGSSGLRRRRGRRKGPVSDPSDSFQQAVGAGCWTGRPWTAAEGVFRHRWNLRRAPRSIACKTRTHTDLPAGVPCSSLPGDAAVREPWLCPGPASPGDAPFLRSAPPHPGQRDREATGKSRRPCPRNHLPSTPVGWAHTPAQGSSSLPPTVSVLPCPFGKPG